MLTSKEIRKMWLDFFKSKGHLVVPSKSLIPQNDPSLLWINSGVATLKDYFSGKKIPPAKRITNSQKSIRTNDIENVGITARHHTFFEMLGNFSIGDYFKKEAIAFGYEFIFNVLKLNKQNIYITYYSEDKDTYNYWISNGIDPSHMIKGSRDTNFWDVGQGPCGPDTEIFYDRGTKYDTRGIELLENDIENDRYIEIWNIVFSQFNNDGENNYTELATKNIDTGAGLERITSILQDAPTNFDTDLFLPIIHATEKLTNKHYDINNYFTKEPIQMKINTQFKIIADHIRASVNAISDGVKPSNIGRGYIIRRLIRRAYRAGISLGITQKAFLYELVQIVKDSLIYDIDVEEVKKVILDEENLFAKTINEGEKLLNQEIEKNGTIDVKIAFKMFDTYGFPIELTREILQEKNIDIDMNEFNEFLKQHQEKSRGNIEAGMQKVINSLSLITDKISEFVGYDHTKTTSKILYLLNSEEKIDNAGEDEVSYLILDKTPFYATSGGQNHDEGYILQGNNRIEVLDVFKDKYWNHVHVVKGKINSNEPVQCFVDEDKRINFARNHSSTHLMFSALREAYPNEIIKQLGSNITYEHFTFDFGLDHRPTKEEIKLIEHKMRQYIARDVKRNYIITSLKKAEEMGAYMTIDESEYHDANYIRVVEFEGITKDLCGGTHVPHSGIIEDFKIVAVDSKGTGIYRLRVVTSYDLVRKYLLSEIQEKQKILDTLIRNNQKLNEGYNFKYTKEIISNKTSDLEELLEEYDKCEEQLRNDYRTLLKQKQSEDVDLSLYNYETINDKKVFLLINIEQSLIKKVSISLREANPDSIIIILNKSKQDSYYFAVASKKYDSNAIFKNLGKVLNIHGGGNAIISQGSLVSNLKQEEIIEIIKSNLCEF